MNRKILYKGFWLCPLLLAVLFFQTSVFTSLAAAKTADRSELADGEYAVEVVLEGGSKKASVNSPALLTVKDGLAYARIEWSSSNYDYMKIGDEKYLPLNEEGNSVFEIPVTVFDEPMTVIADTTAMSAPHEVEYTLTFLTQFIVSEKTPSQTAARYVLFAGIILAALCAGIFFIWKRKIRK